MGVQAFLAWYGGISFLVLLGSVLVLDNDREERRRNRRYKTLSDRERIWIGRAGLACVLWPLMGAAIVCLAVYHLFSTLVRAARGDE